MQYPFKNWQNLKFGYKFGEKTWYSNWHTGLDILVPVGTPIYAPCNGSIVDAFFGAQGGLTIWFLDEKKRLWRFLHCNQIEKLGKYQEGQQIGLSGNSGTLTSGTGHCHIDISLNEKLELNNRDNFIDPLIVIVLETMQTSLKSMQKIYYKNESQIEPVIINQLLDGVSAWVSTNGIEILFTQADYGNWDLPYFAVVRILPENDFVLKNKQPSGSCTAQSPFQITLIPYMPLGVAGGLQENIDTLIHEILGHALIFSVSGENIHDLAQKGIIPNDDNLTAINYYKKIISDKNNNMLKIKMLGKEQYLIGADGKAYHIYNVATLKVLEAAGIVEVGTPKDNLATADTDSGKEIVILDKE